jgi:2',3'-cyclic-nucleotide 2'-phosphodiesterase (5'-nucleotidase family)
MRIKFAGGFHRAAVSHRWRLIRLGRRQRRPITLLDGAKMEIADWLRTIGLEGYEPVFRENRIDEEALLTLSEEQLKQMGIGAVEHRRRLVAALDVLSSSMLGFPLAGKIAALADEDDLAAVLIHLNDTYRIEERLPDVPGMARIATLVKRISRYVKRKLGEDRTLVLHAGDFLSPSLMNVKLHSEGGQMIELLGHCGVDWALLGNHEFDRGPEALKRSLAAARFKVVASNLRPRDTGYPPIAELALWPRKDPFLAIAGFAGEETIAQAEARGGFETRRWHEVLPKIVEQVKADSRLGAFVALSHMNRNEDKQVQETLGGLWHKRGFAYLLGGHDHDISWQEPGPCLLAKNLSNAKTVTVILLRKSGIVAPPKDALPPPRDPPTRRAEIEIAANMRRFEYGDDGWRQVYPAFDTVVNDAKAAWRRTAPSRSRPDFLDAFERRIAKVASDWPEKEVRSWGYIGRADRSLVELAMFDASDDFRSDVYTLPRHDGDPDTLRRIKPAPAAQRATARWLAQLAAGLGPHGGRLVADFTRAAAKLDATDAALRARSTDFGNFVADALKAAAGVDLALVNAGSFRIDDFVAPRVTLRDLEEVFLFDGPDALTVVELTRNEIGDFFAHALKTVGGGGFLQVSDRQDGDWAARPTARVVITKYLLAGQGDGYPALLARSRNVGPDRVFDCLGGASLAKYSINKMVLKGAPHVRYTADPRLVGAAPPGVETELVQSLMVRIDTYIAAAAAAGLSEDQARSLPYQPGSWASKLTPAGRAALIELRKQVVEIVGRQGLRWVNEHLLGALEESREGFERRVRYRDYAVTTMEGLGQLGPVDPPGASSATIESVRGLPGH